MTSTEELKNMLFIHCNNIKKRQLEIDTNIKKLDNDIQKCKNSKISLINELETSQKLLNLMSPITTLSTSSIPTSSIITSSIPSTSTDLTTSTNEKELSKEEIDAEWNEIDSEDDNDESKPKKPKYSRLDENTRKQFQQMYDLEANYRKNNKTTKNITSDIRTKLFPEWDNFSVLDKTKYYSWRQYHIGRMNG